MESREIEVHAVELAAEAGRLVLGHFGRAIEHEFKSKDKLRDPVTAADKASEAFIRQELQRRFPDHAVVGEEGPNSDGKAPEWVWVVDPLDGTTNFLNGLPIFAVSIGVLRQGVPVVGAIFVPSPSLDGGEVYHASQGGGAFVGERALRVAANAEPEANRLAGVPAYLWRHLRLKGRLRHGAGEPRTLGSIAYELALVARGPLQYAIMTGPRIWDIAAGVVLVQEAGGVALTRRGRGPWAHFQRFGEPPPTAPLTLKELAEWRGGILTANPALAEFLSRRLTPSLGAQLRMILTGES